MLVDTIEKVKKVSVGYVGSNGLFDSATVNAYTASLRGLSATQAEVVLSSAGLDSAQRKQIISALEATAATRTLTSEEALSAMTRKMGSVEAAKELLIKSELVTTDQLEAGAEFQVSTEKLKSAVSSGILSQSEADNIAVALGLTGTNIGLGTSFKLLTASIWANIKALAVWLVTNPVGWAILATVAITSLVKGYDALIGRQEKLSRQKIEGIDEDISKLDEEIKVLEELQSKLEDAKGSRYELSQIQTELNDAIGETKGLLNGESKAWDVANAKLKANIELKKQQRKQAQQDKVNESKELFDNNTFEKDWAFDISGEQMRGYGSSYVQSMEWYNSQSEDSEVKQKYKTQQEYSDFLLEFFDFNPVDWEAYWNEQVDTAYDVFEDTINSYDGAGGQDFIKNLISNMVRGGSNLSEINTMLQQVINNTDMQDAINKYWESLVNPDIDSEEALQSVKKIFDDIVAKNPKLKDFFDNFYNGIVAGGKAAIDTSSDVNKMTVSLDQLKTASEGVSALSSAFKQASDDGYMSIDSLSKIQEATKLSGDEWIEYQNKLMNAKAGSAEFNQVMSDLTFRIIDNTFNLEELKDATDEECDAVERQIAAILRENGVTNANAVAHDYVRMARVDAAIAAYDGTQASYDSAAALIKESLSAEQAKRALAQLEIAKILVNNVKINTQSDIENIIALANAAGASAGALLRLQRAKTIIANGFNAKTPGNSGYVSVADMREMDNIQTQLSNNTFDFGFKPLNSSDFTVASYGGNPSSSGGGGSGSDKNDALDNYLKYIKHKKALGYYDDNAKQYINDLQYALNNLTKTEEEQWDLEEQIYSERENLKKEEISGYESWMSHLENLGYYEDDIAKKINDVTWALENQQLTEEEKFKKEEEIYKLTLERNKKIRESVENLAKAHSETYNYALSDVKRYIEQLEHQKALTDDEALIKSIDRAIINSMADGITKAEEAINNLTTDADYWKGEIEKKLKELGASFDISKWFDYEGNITSQFESDMDVLNNSEAENVISSWANIVSEKLKSVADNTNQIFEYQEKIFSDSKEAIEESISDIKEAAEEIFNLRTSKLNSQSTLLKAQHSLINSIAETQHQLDKDILEAETSGARMSERERELLFTRDEYNKLSGKLNDVLSEANDIQDEFNRKLKGATLDTIDEITNHYERQYELKMKEYEIVKAELDVAKAQQKLENVENEKSVRQWDGEKWVYTSVLQDVINAQNELADAKYQLAQAEIEQSQTEAIQEIDAKVDSIETQKNLFIAALEELTEGTSSAREKLNTALNEIADTDISLFRNIIDRVGETLSGLGAVISSVSMGEPVSSSGAVKVVSGMGNGGIHPVDANKASLKNTYAKGSRYTSRGIGLFDEDGLGSEIIVTKDGVLRQFNAGETVFNSDMVQRLWDYASSNPIPWNYPNTNLSNISSLINKSQTTQPVYDNRTYFNGVEINDADGIRIMKEFSTYLKSKV